MKRSFGVLFLFWTGVLIVTYYVVQKPGLLNSFAGLADTFWTLLVATILLFNAHGMGKRILHILKFEAQDPVERLLLGWGFGLGALGLLALFFSVIQLANAIVLGIFQIMLTLYFLLRSDRKDLANDLKFLSAQLNLSLNQYSVLTKLILFSLLAFSFLLTLVPPFEAFDALLYHLPLPATILQNGGLQSVNNVSFWFPSLSENVYLWALGMGSERATQLLHFTWMMLSALLLWYWSLKTWNAEIARKTLLLVAAIPSLPMLASWAYADMALIYYAVAAIYSLTQYKITKASAWLNIAGVMAGFAMSIKYTSFVVPLTCGVLLLMARPLLRSILSAAQFSFFAIAVASPWYIRNVIYMGNPFYPFVFGGRYWDDFLTRWYADAGTGIGWSVQQLIQLPLNVTLGVHDVTFFDGRIGPLFLLFAPLTIWILWTGSRHGSGQAEGWSLFTIGIFTLLSFTAWTFGVIQSSGLWQARLLLPALMPFTIPTALAWDALKRFDTSKLRISFLANALISSILILTVIDTGIFTLQRNPLAVAVGAQSRERYIERINPSYAALMKIMSELPADARVYSLFEPRSYGLPRTTQPDPINYNFAHDVYIHSEPEAIIEEWRSAGYTHVLVYERGFSFMVENVSEKFTPSIKNKFQETLGQLQLTAQTPDKTYSIYKIP